MKPPSPNFPLLCRDLLVMVEDLASPAALAQQLHLAEALKEFADTARPLLQEAIAHGLTAITARRILMGMATIQRLSKGPVVQTSNEAIKGFFVLKHTLAEALEHSLIPLAPLPPSGNARPLGGAS